ncbi:hypothetical protein NKG05_07625 [Oerskovia sp. M15]
MAIALRPRAEQMEETPSAEGLRRLALMLLVGGAYSMDGVPTPLVAAAWPRDAGSPVGPAPWAVSSWR